MSDQVTPVVVASPEASVLMGGLSPVRAGLTSKFLPPPGALAGRRERGSEAVGAYGPAGPTGRCRMPARRPVGLQGVARPTGWWWSPISRWMRSATARSSAVRVVPGRGGGVGHPADEQRRRGEVVELVGPPDAVPVTLPPGQLPEGARQRLLSVGRHGASFPWHPQ